MALFPCNAYWTSAEVWNYVESWQPHKMSNEQLKKAEAISKAITDELGGLGLLGGIILTKEWRCSFSEVSPRPHDTGMNLPCHQKFSNCPTCKS